MTEPVAPTWVYQGGQKPAGTPTFLFPAEEASRCPQCQAPVGVQCRTASGGIAGRPHDARRRAGR